jgi:hypothetical protein
MPIALSWSTKRIQSAGCALIKDIVSSTSADTHIGTEKERHPRVLVYHKPVFGGMHADEFAVPQSSASPTPLACAIVEPPL